MSEAFEALWDRCPTKHSQRKEDALAWYEAGRKAALLEAAKEICPNCARGFTVIQRYNGAKSIFWHDALGVACNADAIYKLKS